MANEEGTGGGSTYGGGANLPVLWRGIVYYLPSDTFVDGGDGEVVTLANLFAGKPPGEPLSVSRVLRASGGEGGQISYVELSAAEVDGLAVDVPDPASAPTVEDDSEEVGSADTPADSGTAGTADDADADDSLAEEQEGFRNVPEGLRAAKIGDKIVLVREITDPDTGQGVGYVAWHVPTMEEWEAIRGDLPEDFVFQVADTNEAMALGVVDGGTTRAFADFDGDPMEVFYEEYAELYANSPLYGDPQVLALLIEAQYEGDTVTQEQLAGTDYYKSRTEAERAWDVLWLQENATARQRLEQNRQSVRTQLQQAGYLNAPDSLVNYLADNNTRGAWSNVQLQQQLLRETDPYAAGASPFAGIYDWSELGQFEVVTDGTDYWVRTEQGDYRLDGPGQVARFAEQAVELGGDRPNGQHVKIGGTHYFVDGDGQHYIATGPGQVAGLNRLYGEAEVVSGVEPPVAGTVVQLFGGAGGIEKVGQINEVGSSGELAAQVGGGDLEATQLGQEERVRDLIRTYVGPFHAANYSDEFVARWAGRLRNEAEGTVDLLTQDLQRDFQALFPGYDGNDLSYESIAGAARGQWQQWSGGPVDEGDSSWLQFLQEAGPAAENREGWLRRKGLEEQWSPTVARGLSGLGQAFGSQVRRSAV